MNESNTKQSSGSVIINVIIGIVAVSAIIWLVMHCPTCH